MTRSSRINGKIEECCSTSRAGRTSDSTNSLTGTAFLRRTTFHAGRIRAFKQLKRELRSYEQAVRRRLPTLKSMLTPEKIAEARVKYLAQLGKR